MERGFGVILFHLKNDHVWITGDLIPAIAIESIMFLSRCFIKAELNYGLSELEVAYLVWVYKRLRIILVSNPYSIVMLIDHEFTKGIVNYLILNTIFMDRVNRRLINAVIYLDAYKLNVVHLPGRLNLVSDALFRFSTSADDELCR